jgi:acyl-CoA thioesterase-1
MSAPSLRRPGPIAVLGAVLVLAFAGCGERPRHAVVPAGATVVALGDSLTYGTGAESASSYPSALAALTAWNVVNAGVPGETAAQGCDRLPGLIAEHRPALVLVLLGGNDFLRRRPDAAIRDALAACAASARDAATTLVLMPVPRLGLSGLADAPLYAEASRTLGVPMVDAGLSELLGQSAMRADAIHLNAAGYRAMAGRIAQGLRAEGLLGR